MDILERISSIRNSSRFERFRSRNIYLVLLLALMSAVSLVMIYNIFIYKEKESPIINEMVDLNNTDFKSREILDLKGEWKDLGNNQYAIAIKDVDKDTGYVFTIPNLYSTYTINASGDIVTQNSMEDGTFVKPFFPRSNIYLVVELEEGYTIDENTYPQLLTYDKYLKDQQHSNIVYSMFMGCIICFITIYLLMDIKTQHKKNYIKECILLLVASCFNFFSSALPHISTNEMLHAFFSSKYMNIFSPLLSAFFLSILTYYCMRIFYGLSSQISFLGLSGVFIIYLIEIILYNLLDSSVIRIIDLVTVAMIMIFAAISGYLGIYRRRKNSFWLGCAMLFLITAEIFIHIEIKGHPITTSLYIYPVCICIYWIIVSIYMRKLQQESQEELFMEKVKNFETNQEKNQLLLNQIKPHFIYNCLSNIKYLYKHDATLADKAMVSFTNYLRHNIDHLGVNTPIPFTREMNNIENYLSLAIIRYNNAFKVEYDIDCDDFNIYPFTLQPLVENAVKHGVSHMKGDGLINFEVYRKDNNIIITIQDNGKGFDASVFSNSSSGERQHVGLLNTIDRIQRYLNGTITIESTPGQGTKITVIFPEIKQTIRNGENI